MTKKLYNALFLCTGNSARSIMAEAILNRIGAGKFRAFSAGSRPEGRVSPYAIDLLENMNFPTSRLRSKSWEEFAAPGAPHLDFAFTVCDKAAGEPCPAWPGQPMTAHWGFPDPAQFTGSEAEIRSLFAELFRQIHSRIAIFVNLPFEGLDRLTLQNRLDDIGRVRTGEPVS